MPTFYITDGTDRIELLEAHSGYALAPVSGGLGGITAKTHAYDAPVLSAQELRFSERYTLVMADECTDTLAERFQKLVKMFRRSWQRNHKLRYVSDVYLVEQSSGETNTRYAKVWSVPELNYPHPVFDDTFEQMRAIGNFGISIERGIWRSGVPGVLPSAITLTPTDGPVLPTSVIFANYQDDHEIDYIQTFGNGGTGWSGNLIAVAAHAMFIDRVTGDEYYIGGGEPFWIDVWNLVTAGVYNDDTTFVYEYSDGAAGWLPLTLGDDLMLYPDSEPWDNLGIVSMHHLPGNDWAADTVNLVANRYWIRITVTVPTAMAVSPANGTVVVYNQHTPEIRVPEASLKGDVPPFVVKRLKSPDGGDEDNTMCSMSRIVAGMKSRGLSGFDSRLNCGGDGLPAGWAVAYGSDTAAVADPQAPGGDRADCDFTLVTTQAWRVRFTGTDKLRDFAGEYRVFLRYSQTDGDEEDLSIKLRVKIGSTDDFAPAFETGEVFSAGTYDRVLMDLIPGDTLLLPFLEIVNADDLDADLIFEIWGERNTGSGELNFIDLILIPADEWIADLNDPISDPESGTSALRGLNMLDIDSGVIENRTIKNIIDNSDIVPVETWSRRSSPIELEPNQDARLYYLIGHYNDGWGEGPFLSENMQGFLAEMYQQACYFYLRGAD